MLTGSIPSTDGWYFGPCSVGGGCGTQVHSCAADRHLHGCHMHGGNVGDAYPNHKYALGSGGEPSAVYPTDSPTHSGGKQKTGP